MSDQKIRVDYDTANTPRSTDSERWNFTVDGAPAGYALYTYRGAGEWYIELRDPSGETTAAIGGNAFSAPWPMLRERLATSYGVDLVNVQVEYPDLETFQPSEQRVIHEGHEAGMLTISETTGDQGELHETWKVCSCHLAKMRAALPEPTLSCSPPPSAPWMSAKR
ncbi:hypothetical protein ACIBEJ_00695 [Nonomuraea sp. NPDC050790]|uniref:hypothetical protein n=1 Tax=Nonomuraea sp. NPDC050790 TaxID=3364371 RepID=UPI0037BD3789